MTNQGRQIHYTCPDPSFGLDVWILEKVGVLCAHTHTPTHTPRHTQTYVHTNIYIDDKDDDDDYDYGDVVGKRFD